MPKHYSLNSLLDDVLQEVEAQESIEKTASVEVSPEMQSEYASYVMKLAEELRALEHGDISYEDLEMFLEKHAGWWSVTKGVAKNIIGRGIGKLQEARAATQAYNRNLQRRVAAWGREFAPSSAAQKFNETRAAANASVNPPKGEWKPWQKNLAIGAGVTGLAGLGYLGGRALAGKGDDK